LICVDFHLQKRIEMIGVALSGLETELNITAKIPRSEPALSTDLAHIQAIVSA